MKTLYGMAIGALAVAAVVWYMKRREDSAMNAAVEAISRQRQTPFGMIS